MRRFVLPYVIFFNKTQNNIQSCIDGWPYCSTAY